VEFRLRNLIIFLVLVALGGSGLYLGRFAVPFSRPSLFPAVDRPLKSARPTEPASWQSVQFADESRLWDWDVQCGEPLVRYLQPSPPGSLAITLVDHGQDLPLGVAYPGADTPGALVFSGCAPVGDSGDGLACQVAVQQGQPGDALDVAVTAAMAYAVQEMDRDTSQANWEQRRSWRWERFRPLIVPQTSEPDIPNPEELPWRSACLHVSRP
jgi:hypothetical protein